MAFRAGFPLRVFVHVGGGSSEFKRLNDNPDGPVGLRRHEMESQAYQRVGLSEPSVFGQTPQKGYTLVVKGDSSGSNHTGLKI